MANISSPNICSSYSHVYFPPLLGIPRLFGLSLSSGCHAYLSIFEALMCVGFLYICFFSCHLSYVNLILGTAKRNSEGWRILPPLHRFLGTFQLQLSGCVISGPSLSRSIFFPLSELITNHIGSALIDILWTFPIL